MFLKNTLIIFASSLFMALLAPNVQAQVIDKIVAQLGENMILLSDIEVQKVQAIQSGYPYTENGDCEILDEILFQNLLINQAQLDSIVIPDAQVDFEIENRIRIITKQIGSTEKLEQFYGKTVTQIKLEFRDVIRKKTLADEMEREITKDVNVTPKEIKAFFQSIPEDSIPLISSQLSFQQIVVFPEITKADKKRAYDKLEGIRQDILKGKSFDTQARIHSEDPGSAALGGKIEASAGMMVPQFESTAMSLKVGEMSNVFETDYGFHIMQLVDRKGDDYVCKHILVIPEFSPESMNSAATKIDEAFTKLKKNEITWEEAVIKYSNDENTKQNKGIITNPITGAQTWSMENLNDVDQQIYLLTDALDKGQISSPSLFYDYMERKQGVRIVRLMERTLPHKANLEEDYALIQKAAETDKKNKVLLEWKKNKITNAFVHIDPSYLRCDVIKEWITN